MIGMPSDFAKALEQARATDAARGVDPARARSQTSVADRPRARATSPQPMAAPQRIIPIGQPAAEPDSGAARSIATRHPDDAALPRTRVPSPNAALPSSSPERARAPEPMPAPAGPPTAISGPPSAPPPLRARTRLPSTEPERDRASQTARARDARASRFLASAEPPTAPADPARGDNLHATRLVSSERGAFASKAGSIPSSSSFERSASLDSSAMKATPVKKWPALSLIGLAIIAFGGVIAVRAPGLLPAPIAALLMRASGSPPRPRLEADPAEVHPPPTAATETPPTAASEAPPTAASEAPPTVSSAAARAPDGSAANVWAPAQGERAQLEKRAIDLLIANDYAGARAVYDKLHALDPSRPEYRVLLDLLARELAPTCGGPGQAPCGVP
jgi:hypothetical protein